MSVFDFKDYKVYFNKWVESMPKKGHGEYRRIAQAMNISTTMISQVFKGDKHLSLEMACEVCEYLKLDDEESDYFLLLVEFKKAGSFKLQKRLSKQIEFRQSRARKLDERLKKDVVLSDETKSIFYSQWFYSAIRLLADIDNFNDVNSISQRLNLPRNQTQKIIDFLVANNLCVLKNNKLKMGPAKTHLDSSDPLVYKHHQNWRLQGIQKMQFSEDSNLFFSGPMVLSQEVAEKIRQELPSFIEGIYKMVIPSKSEVVRCLNIDWFEY